MTHRHMTPLSSLALSAALALGWLVMPAGTHAASKPQTWRGNGWNLTLVFKQMSYGEAFHGTLKHNGKSFVVQGDWIPAGDAGGDLLRLYGLAFGTTRGLVSVATLYSTCNPNCAAARTYKLTPVAPWTLPGMGKGKAVTLTIQA